jgi:hypothetical protein
MKTRSKKAVIIKNRQISSNMTTRSMMLYEQNTKYEFIFDFIDSSREWRSNKISIGNGSFEYTES